MKKSKGKARQEISEEISEEIQRQSKVTKASRSKSQGKAKRTREDDEINEERRTKARKDKWFDSDEALQRYESDYRRRHIVMGKVVKLNFFEDNGLKLKDMFIRLGWEKFIVINQPQYSSLVAMFYCNFECSETKQVSSSVMGRKICFGEDEIARIFKVKRGDIKVYVKKCLIELDGFDQVEALRQVCGRDDIKAFFLPTEFDLSADCRMLHKIVVDCILPRKRSRNYVSYLDFFVIWCILNGKKLDLPYLMITHMTTVNQKGASLPYGMALTSVFASFKLELPTADKKNPRKSDVYNESTLKNMGLIYSEEKGCLIKDEKDNEDGEDDEDLQDNEAWKHPAVSHEAEAVGPSVAAAPMIGATLQLLLTKVGQLDEKVTEKFQTIETRVNDLHSELLKMDKKWSEKHQETQNDLNGFGGDVYVLKEKGNALFDLADTKFKDVCREMGSISDNVDTIMKAARLK